MGFEQSAKSREWMDRVRAFMDEEIAPAMPTYHSQAASGDRWNDIPPIFDELKAKARAAGLWNIFMPPSDHDDEFFTSVGLTNLEYAPIAELMGRIYIAAEIFNCMAPDTGNFEVLHRYGTREQKQRFMIPLRDGLTRSAFLMTEPDVASSDARNIQTSIRRDGDDYVINGRKWWSSGAGHPRCDFFILMGKTDPDAPAYNQQSMILVPRHTPGVTLVRHLPVFGYDHAPHGHFEVRLEDVRVPAENMLLGEGRGFEIAQGRLGPGRIHHTMRNIATMEIALEKMCRRLVERRAFGKAVGEHSVWEERIARARCEIEMSRLLCLKAAHRMDTVGNKEARAEIAMIKIAAPRIAQQIVDDAIQAHGGGGVSDDFGLAEMWANTRIVRLTDGPDEVHERQLARMELDKYRKGAAS
ncbi:MAG: acyl-CoA dehydrogenase [Brevundimonas sp.]|uniref:Acyl-CoA dehydrogenase family protein n=1 Tax=Brevundimonas albigilva TaxID=1312364 RepID=A0ABY4SM22_9CAUL|nr:MULTISPECIES: acyl-CoA dehydrogenase family protein [Brevundimonas]PZU62065.1 MAG: acyl-CoA dehydrogenase [Brevundimonas sp.]URI14731.1 acyl-CoA dehydrogenase family protein [Brevundimonas albigilva]